MLIKSQDRKALVDINGMTVRVLQTNNYKFKVTAYGNNQAADVAEYLGIYNTEERAIEVLDDISSCYKKYSMFIASCDCYDYAVFCMPED